MLWAVNKLQLGAGASGQCTIGRAGEVGIYLLKGDMCGGVEAGVGLLKCIRTFDRKTCSLKTRSVYTELFTGSKFQ